MTLALDEVGQLADAELVFRLKRLVTADRALSAKLLVHLGEMQARELHRELAYESMFEYCRSALAMSEAEAYLRLLAARVGRRFPLVLERLGAGAVHLTGIKLLAPLLTEENHVALLDRARGRTKREIEAIVAELAPKPDVPARLRKLPEARRPIEANTVTSAALFPSSSVQVGSTAVASAPVVSSPPTAAVAAPEQPAAAAPGTAESATFTLQAPQARGTLEQLSPGRFKLELTLDQEAYDNLQQLVELMRHQNPSGEITRIVERALKELRERTMKRRFGQTTTPARNVTREPATPTPDPEPKRDVKSANSRYIPVKVSCEVFARDKGQCTYVSPDGRRCTARGFIQVHHHNTTFARGGKASADNLRLTCRTHNLFLAERDYSRAFMKKKVREAAARKNTFASSGTGGDHS